MTALGGYTVLGLVALAVCGLLWLQRKRRAVLFVALALVGALILNYSLKGAFGRPRPDLVPHGSLVYTASFPSGHSLMSTATYLTRMLKEFGLRITRLASGLPVGGDLEYADEVTLGRAFAGRRSADE